MISENHPVNDIIRRLKGGNLQLGEAVDEAFEKDIWKRFTTGQKLEIVNYFNGNVERNNLNGLTDSQKFLFIYSGLKVEDLVYQSNPKGSAKILKIVLDAYPSGCKSRIMANAFRLYIEDLMSGQSLGRDDLEIITDYVERALTVLPVNPQERSSSWVRIALIIITRLLHESPVPAKNLYEALTLCNSILNISTEKTFNIDWGQLYHSLGMIYNEYPKGDPSENIEKSIHYYKKALQYRTRESNPYNWAMTRSNMGNSYMDSPGGDFEDNLNRAVECYRDALEVRKKDKYPYDWAFTTALLGVAYSERGKFRENIEDLKKAETCYKEALPLFKKNINPTYYTFLNNLGSNYLFIYGMNRDEANLAKALDCFHEVSQNAKGINPGIYVNSLLSLINLYLLEENSKLEYTIDRLMPQLEDTFAKENFSPRLYGFYKVQVGKYWKQKVLKQESRPGKNDIDSAEAYKKAVDAFRGALETFAGLKNFDAILDTCDHLTQTYHEKGMIAQVIETCEYAVNVIEQVRLYKVVEDAKSFEMNKHIHFYFRLFRLYVDQGSLVKALQVADRVKSRALLSGIYDRRIMPNHTDARKYAEEYWDLSAQQKKLLSHLSNLTEVRKSRISLNRLWPDVRHMSAESMEMNTKLDEVERSLSDCLRKLTEIEPGYVEQLHGYKFPDLGGFFKNHRDAGFITFQHSLEGVYFLYIYPKPSGDQYYIKYDFFEYKEMETLNNSVDTWFREYDRLKRKLSKINSKELDKEYKRIKNLMDVMLTSYGEMIGPGIVTNFRKNGITHLICIPNRDNHVIPFSAIRIPVKLLPGSGKPKFLIELFDKITILPNLALIERIGERQNRKPQKITAVTYSPPSNPLYHCEWEISGIESLFGEKIKRWDGSCGDASTFVQHTNQSDVLHISAHGLTAIGDYHQSYILVGNRIRFTYSNILEKIRLENNSLVTLGACETGYTPNRVKRTAWDEYVGLDSAFLQVGANGVVSSIWLARDRVTALLMYLLYKNIMCKNMSPAAALGEAQRNILKESWKSDGTLDEFNRFFIAHSGKPKMIKLNKTENFSHPMEWANFKYLGIT